LTETAYNDFKEITGIIENLAETEFKNPGNEDDLNITGNKYQPLAYRKGSN